MFDRVGKHVNPASILALVALVFAITGGAFAATGHGGSAGAKASAAVGGAGGKPLAGAAKSKGKSGPRGPKGPAGAAGKNGAAGATGPVGPAGAAGAKGENGAPGTAGSEGKAGEGVTIAPATECPEGGTKFSNGTGTGKACNGEEGEQGPAGSPWTAGGTLPAGSTETGAWFLEPSAEVRAGEEEALTAISFPIPLAAPITNVPVKHVFIISEGGASTAECPGSVEDPKAAEGDFCVYIASASSALKGPGVESPSESGGTGTSGALLHFSAEGAGRAIAKGAWAVTAPKAS